MANIKDNKKGFKVIQISRKELVEELGQYGAIGICDYCNETASTGYYIAVLNQWFCPKCYQAWYHRATYYTDTLIKNTTMKKIMFNDKFGLTQAVLEGRKTMTRRIIKCPRTFRGEWVAGFNIHRRHSDKKIVDWPCMYDADEREFDMGEILPKYELGEVVAIAQSYMDVDRFHRKGKNAAYLEYLDSICLN